MSRDWRSRVEDIIEATESALQFVGEMDAAAFKADPRTSAAVLHQIFIVGEAAYHRRSAGERLTSSGTRS